jgi:hypothetical protein
MVYVGTAAKIMQILSKNAHADKKVPNLLLSKAVEICSQKGISHFIYGNYFYGNKGLTPITEFKRRNGFERFIYPRYFVPLTIKGRIALSLGLHRAIQDILPRPLTTFLLTNRARFNRLKTVLTRSRPQSSNAADKPSNC